MAIIWEAKIPNPYYGHIDFNNLSYMAGKIGPYMAIYGLLWAFPYMIDRLWAQPMYFGHLAPLSVLI
jgi:hypothetical protein